MTDFITVPLFGGTTGCFNVSKIKAITTVEKYGAVITAISLGGKDVYYTEVLASELINAVGGISYPNFRTYSTFKG